MTLAGEWGKCNHSSTPWDCQRTPVGRFAVGKIRTYIGWK
jgi:hypothetical protein